MAGSSSSQSPRASSTRRARKSIAHFPGVSDKENNTVTGATSIAQAKATRKTRSKSIGPGGLEVLNETAGNSQKFVPVIRSILKPTISLSPLRQIPPRNKTAHATQSLRSSTSKTTVIESLVDVSVEHDTTRREKENKEIQERREARRKSLANRRVSFAPEATLHTWDIVELAEDATTSSEATNSTRRASSGSTLQSGTITGNASAFATSSFSDPPSTPERHDIQVAQSPAVQGDFLQKQTRRASDAYSITTEDLENFSSPGDSTTSESSRRSGNDTDLDESEDSDEDKDSVVDATETAVINDDDASVHSESPDQTGSTSSSARLDNSLRQAVIQAGTQDLTYAEGDATMDLIEDDTMLVPSATISGARNNVRTLQEENTNPFSPAFAANVPSPTREDETSEMSMDMTLMMGGIINNSNGSPKKGKRKSIANSRRSMTRRRSSVDATVLADETMDFVTVYGGIQSSDIGDVTTNQDDQEVSMDMTRALGTVLPPVTSRSNSTFLDEQDMSMDLTQAIGGVLVGKENTRTTRAAKRASLVFPSEEAEMDLTVGNGRLLSPVTEYTEPSENGTVTMNITKAIGEILFDDANETMNMDMTKAVGSILPDDLKTNDKMIAKQLMEEEADHGQLTRSPFAKAPVEIDVGVTGRIAPSRQSLIEEPHYLMATRSSVAKLSTPSKTPGTPSKQLTPQPNRPTTPSKTPPNPNISMRKTSPKRLFKSSISKSPKVVTPSMTTSKGILDFKNMPLVILTPISRRASGIGIDQIGMGSPMVAAKLDRRASIGDSTPNFVPSGRKNLRFEDPRTMELELDQERAAEEHRESGRGVMENEVDGDETGTLRDVIQSLSPKKNKFKGRKSLAPSARGILGKRPVELDEEDEDATPKRLKGNRSPVKSIHLPGPQKDITLRLGIAPSFVTPGSTLTPVTTEANPKTASTPRSHGRYRNAEAVKNGTSPPASFNEQLDGAQPDVDVNDDVRISLQDFLNLTNIRFMDLTTTKRRHTIAQDVTENQSVSNDTENTFAGCVIAGVCTIPMLDLFQHSCRELKKYISEGRSVVREIENDTLEDNPALFREYMAAVPEIREIMDNQFKNIKVHARGESKATWYEWRTKLFDGLKSGLVHIHEGLLRDDKNLGDQEELIHGTVEPMLARHVSLKAEAELLQGQADELANCDQDELQSIRAQLIYREQEVAEKKKLLAELQAKFEQTKEAVAVAEERKSESIAEIREAERVTDENRGWSYEEVKSLKDKVDAREHQTGWSLETCDSSHPTFAYQKTLFLYIASDLGHPTPELAPDQPISLAFSPADSLTTEPSTVQRFFLQYLKIRLSTLPYNSSGSPTTLKSILSLISKTWSLSEKLTTETAHIRMDFHTTESILNDSTLCIQSMLLLRQPEDTPSRAQTKIHIQFLVSLTGEGTVTGYRTETKAKLVYGDLPAQIKEKDLSRFIDKRIAAENSKLKPPSNTAKETTSSLTGWREAVSELKTALIKGGRL